MATGYFPGTNIPLASFRGSEGKKEELINRLNQDMAAGDIDGMNDAVFSVAYYSVGGQGQGQGNVNVGKVQTGTWGVTSPVGDNRSWAETSINSENDVYIQSDGSVISYDDSLGTLKNGVSTGTWGGQGTGENNPHSGDAPPLSGVTGNPPVNPVITGNKDLISSNTLNWIKGDPWVNPNISGSSSTANLLGYRPWEADYWKTYLPQQMDQMTMGAPVVEPSISYLPGEFRDPATWRAVLDAPGDLMERIPAGAWISNPANWPSSANPWAFTAPGGGTNIAQNVWNAPSLGGDAAQKWAGLLADLDTSPAIDTSTQSLLGV